jgi:hypothetical protein
VADPLWADDLREPAREGAERAVAQAEAGVLSGGLEATVVENGSGLRQKAIPPGSCPGLPAGLDPEVRPELAGRIRQSGRGGGSLPALQRLGKEPSEQLVVSLRKADSQLAGGTPVDLGRTSCPRPAASGQPAVLRHQQLVLDETVEVKRCEGSG